jgi:protease II
MSYLNEYYFFNIKGIDYSKLQLGHFGNFDRYKYLKEVAFKYSFVFKIYNLKN